MKMIVALIKPHKLPDVKQALAKIDVYRMTVTGAKGAGQQKGFLETYRGVVEEVRLHSKIQIEIAVSDSFLEPTIRAIIAGARTYNANNPDEGNIGDGKIFILPMEDCIRIRTGERGQAAIGEAAPEHIATPQQD